MFVVNETKPNQFEELTPGQTIVSADGVQHPWQITSLWSDTELEALNIYRVETTPIHEGKTSVGFTFERDATGTVRQVHTLVDAPLPSVTPRQIRLALSQIGLRKEIEDWVDTQDIVVKDSWMFATEITRDNPLVIAACSAIGKTDEDLDALFALARTL